MMDMIVVCLMFDRLKTISQEEFVTSVPIKSQMKSHVDRFLERFKSSE